MTAKTIFVLYLFIAVFLLESLKKSACFSDGDQTGDSGQKGTNLFAQKTARPKRSPCIVGTRWRTKRCRKGKRALAKTMVRLLNCNSKTWLSIASIRNHCDVVAGTYTLFFKNIEHLLIFKLRLKWDWMFLVLHDLSLKLENVFNMYTFWFSFTVVLYIFAIFKLRKCI